MVSCASSRAYNWIILFSNLALIISVHGQLSLLMNNNNDDKPPPNPFGETDPPMPSFVKDRPTPPPLNLAPNPNPMVNPNPAPVFAPAPAPAPVPAAIGAPPPFNPPTPPPLPTPPPIEAPSSGNQVNDIAPTPFDKLEPSGNFKPEKNQPKRKQAWTQTRSQDSSHDNLHMNGAGWPRVPRSYVLVPSLDEIARLRRASVGDAVAAAKAANTASQLAKGAGSIPGAGDIPGAGSIPDAGSLPGAGSIPGAGSVPDASSIPGAGSIPGAESLPGIGGDPGAGAAPAGEGGQPSISTFPDTDGDIVMPLPKGATPKPTTPRFMLPRQLDAIKANPEALQALLQLG